MFVISNFICCIFIFVALNAPDPVLEAEIDIGFASKDKFKVSVKDRLKWRRNLASDKANFSAEGEISKNNLKYFSFYKRPGNFEDVDVDAV